MKTLNLLTLLVAFVFISCKDKHEFGDLTPPSNVNASFSIVGADNAHPHGDGTGLVNFVVTAQNAISAMARPKWLLLVKSNTAIPK